MGSWKGGKLTQRGKVHEARKGDSPDVCGVDNIATVDLGVDQTPLDTRESDRGLNEELTRRPSASQLFKLNTTLGTSPRYIL